MRMPKWIVLLKYVLSYHALVIMVSFQILAKACGLGNEDAVLLASFHCLIKDNVLIVSSKRISRTFKQEGRIVTRNVLN